MKLYRLMVSILCMALLMVLWGCFPCVAEILVRDGKRQIFHRLAPILKPCENTPKI